MEQLCVGSGSSAAERTPPAKGESSHSSASLQGGGHTRVKLRLYYGGKFAKAPGTSEWRYVGGSCFNDAVPSTFRYSDVCQKLNSKFSDTVSFKYNSPGEELDPQNLVSIEDDDDLEELYAEYFSALSRPGTPLKTFRVKVYVFPALQFETMYAAPDAEDVEASNLGELGSGGINFDSWCSDDASLDSSQRSCGFSAAAELQASADNAFLQALHQQAGSLGPPQRTDRPPHPASHPFHAAAHFPHVAPRPLGPLPYDPYTLHQHPSLQHPHPPAAFGGAPQGLTRPPLPLATSGLGSRTHFGSAASLHTLPMHAHAPTPTAAHTPAGGVGGAGLGMGGPWHVGGGLGGLSPQLQPQTQPQQHQHAHALEQQQALPAHPVRSLGGLSILPPPPPAATAGLALHGSASLNQLDGFQVPTPRAAGALMPQLEHYALGNISKSLQSCHFLRYGSSSGEPSRQGSPFDFGHTMAAAATAATSAVPIHPPDPYSCGVNGVNGMGMDGVYAHSGYSGYEGDWAGLTDAGGVSAYSFAELEGADAAQKMAAAPATAMPGALGAAAHAARSGSAEMTKDGNVGGATTGHAAVPAAVAAAAAATPTTVGEAQPHASSLQPEQRARLELLQQEQEYAGCHRRGFTADDFVLDDPYHEDGSLDGVQDISPQGEASNYHHRSKEEREEQFWKDLRSEKDAGEPLSEMPLGRALGSASRTPQLGTWGGSCLGGGSPGSAGQGAATTGTTSADRGAPPGGNDNRTSNTNGNKSNANNASNGSIHSDTDRAREAASGNGCAAAGAQARVYSKQHGVSNGGSRLGVLLSHEDACTSEQCGTHHKGTCDGGAHVQRGNGPHNTSGTTNGTLTYGGVEGASGATPRTQREGAAACAQEQGSRVAAASAQEHRDATACTQEGRGGSTGANGAGSHAHSGPPTPSVALHFQQQQQQQQFGAGAGVRSSGRQQSGVGLPSHISAFGEGLEEEQQQVCAIEEAREAERQRLQQMYGDIDVSSSGSRRLGSRCITQELSNDGDGPVEETPVQQKPPPAKATHANNHCTDLSPLLMPQNLLASITHVPMDQVTVTHKIGEGAFGEVSRAEVFPFGTVAIKWLKRDRFTKHSSSFMREAEVLARLNHPNIIRMFGLVTEPLPSTKPEGSIIAGIMMEHVRGGSLSARLRLRAQAGQPYTLRERCHIALQAALGMAYLHDQKPAVIHFDLKPDNLLIERDGVDMLVKTADFGLSKHKFQSFVTCHDLRGTLPYMAPEVVSNPTQVSEKCDIWSFGVSLWQMWALKEPFHDLSAQQILVGLMHGTLHLPLPRACEPEWRQLIKACMEPDPADRPTFKALATQIRHIMHSGVCADDPVQPTPPLKATQQANLGVGSKMVRV